MSYEQADLPLNSLHCLSERGLELVFFFFWNPVRCSESVKKNEHDNVVVGGECRVGRKRHIDMLEDVEERQERALSQE